MPNFMADLKVNKIILVIHSPFLGGAINVYFLPLGQHLSILAETIEKIEVICMSCPMITPSCYIIML